MKLDLGGGHIIDVEKQLAELDRVDCEESLYTFLKAAWPHIDPAPWKDGWPIEAVAEHLQAVADGEIKRLIINIPPRMAKSSICSVAFPAWCWAQPNDTATSGPSVQFLHGSYAEKLSLRDSVKCRRLIQSPWYQSMWGKRFRISSDQNVKSRFSNDRGGERLITSIGGGATGEGGSCFVGGTLVATPSGAVPIEQIKRGDVVYAFDHQLGKVVKSKVVATAERTSSDIYELRTHAGHRFSCTGDHPIFLPGRGYICASDLGEGDRLLVASGSQETPSGIVTSVANVEFVGGREVRVYDIQVEGRSNFFANGVLVHNCIIIDDPNAANEAFSEATIQSTIDWWDGTMSTRLNDAKTGAFIVIQQRLAEDDLTGHILSKDVGEWTHLMLPMRYEPERALVTRIGWEDPRREVGELLWPDRFGEAEVRGLERSLGKFGAAGQLQQSPQPAGGGIVKRDSWQLWADLPCRACPSPEKGACVGCGDVRTEYPPMDFIMASLDTAFTEKTINDASALTVWGVFTTDPMATATRTIDRDGRPVYNDRTYAEQAPKVMLMHAWNARLEFRALVDKVADTCKKMKVDLILIEAKAAGHSVAQELRRIYSAQDFSVKLYDPKSLDKTARLFSVAHLFEDGTIYAPERPWANMVIDQVASFPNGKHDDLVDTVSQAIRHMRDMGLLIRTQERLEEIEAGKAYSGRPPGPLYPG